MALPYTLTQRMAAGVMRGAQTGKTHPFFSNMGVLDAAWVGFGDASGADAYGVGPVLHPPGFFLALSTFRGVLTLATCFCHTRWMPAAWRSVSILWWPSCPSSPIASLLIFSLPTYPLGQVNTRLAADAQQPILPYTEGEVEK